MLGGKSGFLADGSITSSPTPSPQKTGGGLFLTRKKSHKRTARSTFPFRKAGCYFPWFQMASSKPHQINPFLFCTLTVSLQGIGKHFQSVTNCSEWTQSFPYYPNSRASQTCTGRRKKQTMGSEGRERKLGNRAWSADPMGGHCRGGVCPDQSPEMTRAAAQSA